MALLECTLCGVDIVQDCEPTPLEASLSCRKITVCSCMCCKYCFEILAEASNGGCRRLHKADSDNEEVAEDNHEEREEEAKSEEETWSSSSPDVVQDSDNMVAIGRGGVRTVEQTSLEDADEERSENETPSFRSSEVLRNVELAPEEARSTGGTEMEPSREGIDHACSPTEDIFTTSSQDARPFVVTHFESPDAIFLRPLWLDAAWIAFDARVGQILSKTPVCSADDVRAGDNVGVCLGLHWHRAKVLSREGESARVRLIDRGKVVSVALEEVTPLPLDLRHSNAFCHCVKLAHVLPAGSSDGVWSRAATEELAKFIPAFSDVFVTMAGRCEKGDDGLSKAPVIIWVKETFAPGAFSPLEVRYINVAGWLCENGFAFRPQSFKELATSIQPFKSENIEVVSEFGGEVADVPEEILTDFEPPRVPSEREFEGTVTYIDHEGQIYVLPDDNAEALLSMEEEMAAFGYGTPTLGAGGWRLGGNLLAKYPSDEKNGWYRAKITHLGFDESGDRVLKVLFVDYGEQKLVFPSRGECCADVPQEILRVPILAVRCKLANVVPVEGGYSVPFLDSVHKTIVDKRVHVRRAGSSLAFPMSGVVHLIAEPRVNVARMFVTLGFSRLIERKEEWTSDDAHEREEALAGHIQPVGYVAQIKNSSFGGRSERKRGAPRFPNVG